MFRGVQLASEYSGFRGPSIIEPKIDGYRMVAIVGPSGVTLYSRSGKTTPYNDTLAFLAREIAALRLPVGTMLDGEIVAGDWNSTAIIKKTRVTAADRAALEADVSFWVFDIVAPRTSEHLLARKQRLAAVLPSPTGHLLAVPWFVANSEGDVQAFTAGFLQRGYEGSIVKNPSSLYSFKRDANWQKIKRHRTFEVMPVAYLRGTGKYSGTLGAIEVVDQAGNRFRVGTGFTDAQRASIWRKKPMGVPIEVSVQDSDVSEFRHPSFVRFRVDIDDPRVNPSAPEKRAGANAAARARRYRESIVKKLISEKQCSEYEAKELVKVAGAIDVEPDFLLQMNDCYPASVGSAFNDAVFGQMSSGAHLEDIVSEEHVRGAALSLMHRHKNYNPKLLNRRFVLGGANPYDASLAVRVLLSRYSHKWISDYEEIVAKSIRGMGRDKAAAFALAIVAVLDNEYSNIYAVKEVADDIPRGSSAERSEAAAVASIARHASMASEDSIAINAAALFLRKYMRQFGFKMFGGRDPSAEQIKAILQGAK